MTTILPEKNKRELKWEYLARLSKSFVWSLILINIVFLALQITIYFSIKIENEGLQKISSEPDQQQRSSAIAEYKNELTKINSYLDKFNFNKQSIGEIMDFVYKTKQETVSINSMSVDNREDGDYVTVSGFSTNREDLLYFSQALEKSENISDFNLPLSSFTKNKEIPFSLTFKYKKHE